MSTSREALLNIAMLHLTRAEWKVDSKLSPQKLRAIVAVERPGGTLNIHFTSESDSLHCIMTMSPYVSSIKIMEGEAAKDFYRDKLEEVLGVEEDLLLRTILNETPQQEHKLEVAGGGIRSGIMRAPAINTLSLLDDLLQFADTTTIETIAYTRTSEENEVLQKQLSEIRKKYQVPPAKRK